MSPQPAADLHPAEARGALASRPHAGDDRNQRRASAPAAILVAALTVAMLAAAACSGLAPSKDTPQDSPRNMPATTSLTPAPPDKIETGPARRAVTSDVRRDPSNRVRFGRISVEQGLSQSIVTSILRDRYGFMWFGTEDGLNRYDGSDFKAYRHDPEDPDTLGDNLITALYEDSSGILWVGTAGSGLDRFDRDAGRFIHYRRDSDDPTNLSSNAIRAIAEDSSGTLWIGTESGVNQLDRQTGRFSNFVNNPDAPQALKTGTITAIYQSKPGILWFGTADGLIGYDQSTRTFVRYQHESSDPQSLSHNVVSAIHEDSAGRLWVGTWGGLDILDPESGRFTALISEPDGSDDQGANVITAICQDRAGDVWIGTNGGGLARFDPATSKLVRFVRNLDDPSSLSNDIIRTIYEDASGILWVGTEGGGASTFDRQNARFALYRHVSGQVNSLRSDVVMAVYEDPEGILWVGTDDGLDSLDRGTGRYTHYPSDPRGASGLSHNRIRAIHRDSTGALWVGTEGGGLSRLDPGAESWTYYGRDPEDPASLASNTVSSIFEDGSGTLWFGTEGGLEKFDRRSDSFIHFRRSSGNSNSLSNNDVWALYRDRAGALWVGTGSGLNKVDPATGKAIRYLTEPDAPGSFTENSVLSIHQDPSGMMWIGLLGGGLTRLDPETGATVRYREKQGLPNDTVYGILEDDEGFLWLSTNKGIARFDPRTETFENYDKGDGLQGNQFNRGSYYEKDDGEMFFGGIDGLTAFYPTDIGDNPYAPPVTLTALTQEGEGLAVGMAPENVKALTLRWPRNSLEFEFAAPSYVQTDENRYAYKLEDFDQNWNYARAKGLGRYTNLPGGAYTLRLKAANNDGAWNEEGRAISVTVIPPLWQTRWFQGLLLLAAIASVIGGYRWRLRNVEARNRTLAVEVGERTLQIAQRTADIEALYQADAELERHVRLDELLQALVDIAVDQLKADKSAVLCWDDERKRIVVRVARGFSVEAMAALSFARGEGLAGQVMATGEPAAIGDTAADLRAADERPEVVQVMLTEGIRSFLHLPIKPNSEVFGVFSVGFTTPHAFGERDQRLFTALAQRATIAVENARYFDEERRRAEQLGVINEVGRQITSILDVDQVLQEIVQAIQGRFDYQVVSIALVEGDELVIKASAPGRWQDLGIPPLRVKVAGEGVVGWVAGTSEPLLVPDVSQEPRYLAWPKDIPTRSELAVPMIIKSGAIGVLNVESTELNAFDASDLAVLQSLANQAAIAVENARLFHSEQRRSEQFRVLAEVGRRIASVLGVNEVLEQVARLVQQAFGYYHVGIGLIEGDQVVYRVGAGALWDDPEFRFKPQRLKIGQEGLSGWVVDTGRSLLVPDVSQDPRYVWMQGSKTCSEITVPILVKKRVIGVLDAQSDRLNAFDESDLAVLEFVANQTGIAIENARLYEEARNRVAQLTALQETSRALASTLELETLLNLIIQQATTLLQGNGGLVNLVDWEKRQDEVLAATGSAIPLLGAGGPLEGSLSGWVTLHNQAVVCNQVPDDSRVAEEAGLWVTRAQIQSAALAPLSIKEQVIGTLVVLGTQQGKRTFDQADLDLLVAFANQAAVAIENARLYERAQELAVMRERSRLARDLHDAVTQTLFSASLIAEALPATWEGNQEAGRQLLDDLRQLTRGALAEMRTLLLELRPAALVEADLGDLLRQLAESVAGRSGIPVTVAASRCPAGSIPDDVHIALYRIAQESLNNVVKHAHASRAEVSLRMSGELGGTQGGRGTQVELEVADDGRGFDPAAAPPDHLGMKILRERAQAIGAELSIESAPECGTRVTVVWTRDVRPAGSKENP